MKTAFAFAYTAGVLAAFNPCGSAMLPAWIGYFLLDEHNRRQDALTRLLRALWTALTVTTGLVLVFAITGIALAEGLAAIRSVLPFAILTLGAALTILGANAFSRGELPSLRLRRPSIKPGRRGLAMITFGAAYGTAALSYALPVFLISVGAVHGATWSNRILGTAGFTAGMASVLTLITVTTTFTEGIADKLATIRSHIPRLSGLLLIAAGAWTTYGEIPLTAVQAHLPQPTEPSRLAITAGLTATALAASKITRTARRGGAGSPTTTLSPGSRTRS